MADGMVQEMANQLAEECLSLQAKTGDDRLFMEEVFPAIRPM